MPRKANAELREKICGWFWNYLVEHPGVPVIRIAKEAGIDRNILYQIRDGTKAGSIETLIRIADYTGVSLDEICGRKKHRRKGASK